MKSDGSVVSWRNDGLAVSYGVTSATAIVAGGPSIWVKVSARPVNAVTITSSTVVSDGQPHVLAISTANGRTPTTTTYNGSFDPPTVPGTYIVVSEADYLDSYGVATGSLIITDPMGGAGASYSTGGSDGGGGGCGAGGGGLISFLLIGLIVMLRMRSRSDLGA